MQTEIAQTGTNPYLMMLYGAIIALAPVLITLASKYISSRKADQRLNSNARSQIELKRIEVEAAQSHEKRDDLKIAQDQCDEWMAKYYELKVAAKESELMLKLELAQLKEQLQNAQLRLRMYEKHMDPPQQ